MFQFLIGTIKTIWCKSDLWYHLPFQFLIGTIKTVDIQALHLKVGKVSIPYRYYKNGIRNFELNTEGKFQFLIGTIKTQKQKWQRFSGL